MKLKRCKYFNEHYNNPQSPQSIVKIAKWVWHTDGRYGKNPNSESSLYLHGSIIIKLDVISEHWYSPLSVWGEGRFTIMYLMYISTVYQILFTRESTICHIWALLTSCIALHQTVKINISLESNYIHKGTFPITCFFKNFKLTKKFVRKKS